MKFLSCEIQGRERLGWLLDDERTVLLVDPSNTDLPQSMVEFIEAGPSAIDRLKMAEPSLQRKDFNELKLLPPIANPGGIFCVAVNYSREANQVNPPRRDYPTVFLRLGRNQVASGLPLWKPSSSDTLDWEGELVAVIGKAGRNIGIEEASQHIFGYSIYNEGTVRGVESHPAALGLSKNFQASASFGPIIVTAEEFGDPYEHRIQTRVNDQLMQDASVSQMLHKIEEVIAYLSSATELLPGDIICTGTPWGMGIHMEPARYLQEGDVVEVSIEAIGQLRNPVINEPDQ